MMRRLVGIIVITLWPMVVTAEWQTQASVSSSVENNVFRNSSPEKDVVTEADLYVAHAWNREKWSALASYEGNYINFADHAERNYLLPQISLTAQRNLEKNSWIRSGLRARTRIDGDNYVLYDFHEYGGFVDVKLPDIKHLTVLGGYSLRNRRYDELEELNNLEHQLYCGLKMPLEGGTNITISSELGYKQYLSSINEGTTISRKGYRGRKIVTTGTNTESANVGQWVNSLSVSTPVIDNKTGIRLYVKKRMNFGDSIPLVSGLSVDHYSEDDLFDDRYGYESREFGGMVSRVLPYAVTARIGYDQALKDYTETALDVDGKPVVASPRRSDNYRRMWAQLEKSVSLSAKGTRLRMYAEYQKIWNNSNDAVNDYRAATATAGVELLF